MHALGAYALRCACVVALYAVSMALLGVRLGRQEMVRSAELVLWLWIGGLVIVMGTIIALWPERSAARTGDRRAPVPVGTVSAPEESS